MPFRAGVDGASEGEGLEGLAAGAGDAGARADMGAPGEAEFARVEFRSRAESGGPVGRVMGTAGRAPSRALALCGAVFTVRSVRRRALSVGFIRSRGVVGAPRETPCRVALELAPGFVAPATDVRLVGMEPTFVGGSFPKIRVAAEPVPAEVGRR